MIVSTAERLLLIRRHDPTCTLTDLVEDFIRPIAMIEERRCNDEIFIFGDDSTLVVNQLRGEVSL